LKTLLTLEVEYDPTVTNPEGLAAAMDRLMETACSTPGILDDYANPMIGPFFVATPAIDSVAAGPQRVVVNVYGGVVQDVFCSDPHARAAIVDWGTESRDPCENGIVEVQTEDGGKLLAYVADYPTQPWKNLPDTDIEKALVAAKLAEDWLAPSRPEQYSPPQATRRYILYDFDAGDLATTTVYDSYPEAADDASELDNVIVVPLVFEKEAGDVAELQSAQPVPYHLTIDGPQFRAQRELLLKLQGLAGGGIPYSPARGELERLEGLIELTDGIADQAHDNYAIDCLLDVGEGPCACEKPW